MSAVCLLRTLAQTTESLLSLGLLVLKLKLSLACHLLVINRSFVCCSFKTYRPSLPSQKAGCCRFSVGCVLCVHKFVLHNLRYKPKDATFFICLMLSYFALYLLFSHVRCVTQCQWSRLLCRLLSRRDPFCAAVQSCGLFQAVAVSLPV